MALRPTAFALLVTAAGCERMPAGQLHGEPIWEREVGTRGAGLGAASGGDLFMSDGSVSRLAPSGVVRWSVDGPDGPYGRYVVIGPGDDLAVTATDGTGVSTSLDRLDGADGSLVTRIERPNNRARQGYGLALLPELVVLLGGFVYEDPQTGEPLDDPVSFVELYDRAGVRVSHQEFTWNPDLEIVRDPRGGFVIAGWDVNGNTDFGLGPLASGETGVTFLARFDDEGALVSQHLAPDLFSYRSIFIGDDGAVYGTSAAHPGDLDGLLARADETGAIEWELGIHGDVAAYAGTIAAGVDGDVLFAAGHLEGELGFGLLPDPAASGTSPLPSDEQSFLVSVEAATGAVRWQRGLEHVVEGPLVADAVRGFYLVEGHWREFEGGEGNDYFLVARED